MFHQLEAWLAEITGLSAVSLQPNAGSQGEYTGLMVIRAYHRSQGEERRDVCLIPLSAHGTNPASASMVGMTVVTVACDRLGNVDLADLEAKAAQHREQLSALMLTYPSTHGVFEADVRRICQIVHTHGDKSYGWCQLEFAGGTLPPGDIARMSASESTQDILYPPWGGGPGMDRSLRPHLAPFLPGHPVTHRADRIPSELCRGAVRQPSIVTISWSTSP